MTKDELKKKIHEQIATSFESLIKPPDPESERKQRRMMGASTLRGLADMIEHGDVNSITVQWDVESDEIPISATADPLAEFITIEVDL